MKMDIARELIEKGCVQLSPERPFSYASGLVGPIYCDNRLLLGDVSFREKVISGFLNLMAQKSFQFDLVGGIATAGIPHAAFISDRLKRPMIYIRPKPKDHGKKNQIEGKYLPNQSVILIEDLVNQGSSLTEAVTGIKNAGLVSSVCLCIVDYQMHEAQKKLIDLELQLYSLTDFEHLVKAALELKLIDQSGKNLLIEWQADPKGWSNRFK